MSSQRALTAPAPRRYRTVNWVGLQTLYMKEVRRFMTVATQTILAPMVTTLLFLAVFVLALGRSVDEVGGEPYMAFLAPGLIMMAIAQNAFANTSSSILISKVQGNIVDHQYDIEQGGRKIAEVSKAWFRVRDTYGVEVQPGQDDALILAITVVVDQLSGIG